MSISITKRKKLRKKRVFLMASWHDFILGFLWAAALLCLVFYIYHV